MKQFAVFARLVLAAILLLIMLLVNFYVYDTVCMHQVSIVTLIFISNIAVTWLVVKLLDC